jgi:outer membrane protein assembly factor BamA
VANAVEADRDIEALKKLYGTRGYVGIEIHPTPEIDDADSSVKYVFQFQEGSIYKMGDLEVRGLDSKATERMVAAWRLLSGETYNSGYGKQFLDSIATLYPADQWKISLRESPEDQDKVVDVSLHFDARR